MHMSRLAVGFTAALVFASCSSALNYELRGTSLSPGADARVVARPDEARGVTQLDIEALNLTPPERLVEGGQQYVIWARASSKEQWSRLGALDLRDEGRKGNARLTTPQVSFDLAISAEREVTPDMPSGKIVFEQRVSRGEK